MFLTMTIIHFNYDLRNGKSSLELHVFLTIYTIVCTYLTQTSETQYISPDLGAVSAPIFNDVLSSQQFCKLKGLGVFTTGYSPKISQNFGEIASNKLHADRSIQAQTTACNYIKTDACACHAWYLLVK